MLRISYTVPGTIPAKVSDPSPYKNIINRAAEPAPAPTYLLHAWVSWGRIRPAVVVLINSTYFLHKVPVLST